MIYVKLGGDRVPGVDFIRSNVTPLATKPYPRGIVDLTATLDPVHRIGTITQHYWQHALVDGVRIRLGWQSIQDVAGAANIDWSLIDECAALAATSGKFLGVGVAAGQRCPGHALGGARFIASSISGFNVNSTAANFQASDVGKIIWSYRYPDGFATIQSVAAPVATVDIAAVGSISNQSFYILGRTPNQPWHLCTGGQELVILPIPWDPFFKSEYFGMIAAAGARYDSNPSFRYMEVGTGRTGEAYWVQDAADVAFYDQSALDAGYVASGSMSPGCVGWLDMTKQWFAAYAAAFPLTTFFLTMGQPFPDPGGSVAMGQLVSYGVTNFPGRFGIMNAQLNVSSTITDKNFVPIHDHAATQPTGVQYLCNATSVCSICQLCRCNGTSQGCGSFGGLPCLDGDTAFDKSYLNAEAAFCRYVETYEADLNNITGNHQAILAAHRNTLLALMPE